MLNYNHLRVGICKVSGYRYLRGSLAPIVHVFSRVKATDAPEPRPTLIPSGPGLRHFLASAESKDIKLHDDSPYISPDDIDGCGRKVFLEIYGCQMNVNDGEIVLAILTDKGYVKTDSLDEADVVLLLTCAIREGAETKVWDRLKQIRHHKRKGKTKNHVKIGLLGCMAERLKQVVLERERSVDIVAGPDSYKDLPRLLSVARDNQTAVNVQLSADETYADIMPLRLSPDSISAFVSIMRGCDNMCTYCIVPFTRGRERSRPLSSIVDEVRKLSLHGVKEVTLLGQNVNSYRDIRTEAEGEKTRTQLADGFSTVYKPKIGGVRFARLLADVAQVDPNMRIRFTSPHPKDFPDEVLEVMARHNNICRSLHLPAQAGSSAVLSRMRRGYTREAYLALVDRVRQRLPQVAISTDLIAGFCGETEDEFSETLTLMQHVRYATAYLFAYSMREKTTAHRRFIDDVPQNIKNRRVTDMTQLYRETVLKMNRAQIGHTQLVLVEGTSKRSDEYLAGRNDGNVKVILPKGKIASSRHASSGQATVSVKPGDYVAVLINDASSQVLKGIPLYHTSIPDFYEQYARDTELGNTTVGSNEELYERVPLC